jgi:hypothetical protein
MSEPTTEARREALARCFGHHFVGLIGRFRELDSAGKRTGKIATFKYSGFVSSFINQWYFVTAGHALEEIRSYLQVDTAEIGSCHLIDNFGAFNTADDTAIPFANAFEHMFYVNDPKNGLDFGIIPLDANKLSLLTANGILALTEDRWANQNGLTFFRYAVLGLPEEMNHESPIPVADSIAVPSTFVVTFASDRKIPSEIRNTYKQWLVLRLQRQNALHSIVG